MKYVPIKARVRINFENGRDEQGNLKFVERSVSGLFLYKHLIDTDRTLNVDGAGIRASGRIESSILSLEESSEFLPLEDADWAKLKAAAENPTAGYPTQPARRCECFLVELEQATDKRPEPEAKTNGASAEQPS